MKKGPKPGSSATVQAMIGNSFGRWKVLSYAGTRWKSRATMFNCKCQCGKKRVVQGAYLRKGNSRSCGCLHKEIVSKLKPAFKHGHSVNPKTKATYHAWGDMFSRCYNPIRRDYRWYGALGVTVCKRWEKFDNFVADMGLRPEGLTLDRINPHRNYEPKNCRWATWEVQANNKRSSKTK